MHIWEFYAISATWSLGQTEKLGEPAQVYSSPRKITLVWAPIASRFANLLGIKREFLIARVSFSWDVSDWLSENRVAKKSSLSLREIFGVTPFPETAIVYICCSSVSFSSGTSRLLRDAAKSSCGLAPTPSMPSPGGGSVSCWWFCALWNHSKSIQRYNIYIYIYYIIYI